VQTKTLSLKEFKTGLLTGNSFLYEVMRTGIILYSKISMNDLEKWIKECKKNLKVRISHLSPMNKHDQELKIFRQACYLIFFTSKILYSLSKMNLSK